MPALKCPNPVCPYLFDPTGVPPGAVLACPRCNMHFTLAAPPPAAPAPASLPPTQMPAPRPRPRQAEPPAPVPDDEPEPAERMFKPVHFLLLGGIAVVFAGVVAVAFLMRAPRVDKPAGGGVDYVDLNVHLDPPPDGWVTDDDLKGRLGTGILQAYRHPDPEAFFAFGGRDYRDRAPRTGELQDALSGPIDRLFENVDRNNPVADATWLGRPARLAFQFTGQARAGGGRVVGQGYAVADKGVGYWCLAWAAEQHVQSQVAVFDDFRGRFHLLAGRAGWAEKQSNVKTFAGVKAAYRLLDADAVWREAPTRKASDETPVGDLLLETSVKKRKGGDAAFEAELITLVVDGGADPAAGARAAADKYLNAFADVSGKTTLDDVKGEIDGDPPANPIDKTADAVLRLQARTGTKRELVVVGALKVGDKLVVAVAHAPWADRAYFEPRLMQLVGTLRPR